MLIPLPTSLNEPNLQKKSNFLRGNSLPILSKNSRYRFVSYLKFDEVVIKKSQKVRKVKARKHAMQKNLKNKVEHCLNCNKMHTLKSKPIKPYKIIKKAF